MFNDLKKLFKLLFLKFSTLQREKKIVLFHVREANDCLAKGELKDTVSKPRQTITRSLYRNIPYRGATLYSRGLLFILQEATLDTYFIKILENGYELFQKLNLF